MRKNPSVPKHLKGSAELFRHVTENYELDAHHVETLIVACGALDRATEAREILDRDGIVIVDRLGGTKPHPAVAIEVNAQAQYLRAVRALGLDLAAEPERQNPIAGRPGKGATSCQG